jgi:hypothetical protein
VVVEIITNQIASALELLARQQTQIYATIYQNLLALEDLLADGDGICGKFNPSDCCLQIDDNEQTVTNTATNIRKSIQVPVRTWDGVNLMIGLVAGSHGFSLSWDPLLLSELFCAAVPAS